MADQSSTMNHVDLYVTPALFYIETLVKALNKKNHKALAQELASICTHQGPTANRHLLQTLFTSLDFSLDPQVVVKTKDFHQALPVQLLVQQVSTLFDLPLFRTVLSFCFEHAFDPRQIESFLGNQQLIPLCGRILRFNREQENRLCILLLKSNIPQIRQQAAVLIRQKFGDILKLYCDADERLLQDTDKTVFHELLLLLEPGQREELAERVSPEQEEEFRSTLRRLYPDSRHLPLQLKPLLLNQNYADADQLELAYQLNMSRNPPKINLDSDHDLLVRLLIEFGYKAIDSIESCRSCFGGISTDYITPESVARCIGVLASIVPIEDLSKDELEAIELDQDVRSTGYYVMWSRGEMRTTRTEARERDRHRMENFVTAVCEKCPGLSWREVVYEMDHEGFSIYDRAGLQLVLIGLGRGLQNTPFPIELLYRHWTNADAQLAWFTHALKNPDIFCFAEFTSDRADIQLLKAVPEDYRHREIQVWLCMDLVETLLYLADSGFSQEVMALVDFPLLRCPDILLVTLLQLSPSGAILNSRTRHHLVRLCVQKFLILHPNSQVVLHYAWTSYPNNKLWAQQLVIEAMADWYITGRYDQNRLARILDVAQDLKSLADLLQCDILPFVIDLACLAARREYLKLDKWMQDKMAEPGVKFATACLKFLERRCPTLVTGDPLRDEQTLPRNAQLPADTINTFIRHLEHALPHLNIGFDTVTIIMKLIKNSPAVSKRPNPPPNVLKQQAPSPSETIVVSQNISHSDISRPISEPNKSVSFVNVNPGPIGPNFRHNAAAVGGYTGVQQPFSPPPQTPSNVISHNASSLIISRSSAFNPPQNISTGDRSGSQVGGNSMSSGSNDLYAMLPEVQKKYPPEVEEEVYACFQSMFGGRLRMASFIETMRMWKKAGSEKDHLNLDCTMKTIYEEHQWLHQYPENEFDVTARFFGALIDNGFLSYMGLGIALRQLLDFLRLGPSNRYFRFALLAMDMFKDRLQEYSQYCMHVTQTPYFKDFPPLLREYVINGARANEKVGPLPGSPVPVAGQPRSKIQVLSPVAQQAPRHEFGSDSDESDSEPTPIVIPPETVRDRLGFLFNNISMANVKDKVIEFRELLKGEESERYIRWIAEYIVRKRAGLEQNFHPLYHCFVEKVEMPKLYSFIVKDTVLNIKQLLRTEKSADNFNDRSVLKNLGAWLGYMTLAMNRPVRARDIDMKALIVEAYHKGPNELNYAIPLVAKILGLSAKSKLFGKNNPWIRAILALLGAIHAEQETKLHLKFEVEVLSKTLELSVAELGESPLLKNPEYVRWVMDNAQQLFGAPRKPKQTSGPPEPRSVEPVPQPPPLPQPPQPPPSPPEGVKGFRYHYKELHPPQFQSTYMKIHFNMDVNIFQGDTSVRNALRIAVERTLQEFLMPCVERCLRIAVPAALVVARKDFSLDGDPERVLSAGVVMVRHLASGLAFATVREHLFNALILGSKSQLLGTLRAITEEQQNMVLRACEIFAKDNLELCSAFLQKAAAERCIMEIEKTLHEEVKRRVNAKREGKVWYDEEEAAFQRDRIPASLRMGPGAEIRETQLSVYESFAANIPGFMTDAELVALQKAREHAQMMARQQIRPQPQVLRPGVSDIKEEDFVMFCDQTMQKLTGLISIMSNLIANASENRHLQLTIRLKNKIQDCRAIMRPEGPHQAAIEILQYIVELLLDGLSTDVLQNVLSQQPADLHAHSPAQDQLVRFKDACIGVIVPLHDPKMFGPQFVMKVLAGCLLRKEEIPNASPIFPNMKASSFETFNILIRARFIPIHAVDGLLFKVIESGAPGSQDALGLAQLLVRTFCVEDKMITFCGESDLFYTIEAITRYCVRHNDVPFPFHFLMDEVKVDLSPCRRYDHRMDAALESPLVAAMLHTTIVQVRDAPDVAIIREKAEVLLRDWFSLVNGPHFAQAMHLIEKSSESLPHAMDVIRTAFQRVLNDLRDLLVEEGVATRFFKICVEICARDCYRSVSDQPASTVNVAQDQMRSKMAPMLDALARLFVLIIRFSSDTPTSKGRIWLRDPIMAVSKILGIIAGVMFNHQDLYDVQFLAYPFHRIVYSFYMDIFIPEFKFVQIQEQLMLCFCNFFHAVRPQKLPGFTASWLELVYHRDVIRRINEIPEKKGWEMFVQLMVNSIRFVAPFVRNLTLNRALSIVFRALLRFLYTLLHDYPEVLAEYYCVFVDVIPTNCLNMRNVVLSAAPLAIIADDPYTATFKIEDQKGIDFLPPRIVTRYHMFLQPISFRNDLDSYLSSRAPVTFLADLIGRLEQSRIPGHRYHVQMLNALVLYLGQQAVQSLTNKGMPISSTTVAHSSHMDIIQNLAINFDNEGRYLLVNALVNHLRYPNIHTHYYYCVILHLFRDMSNHQHLQELIVRVLLERITSHRPHPWGLVAACSQLIRGPEYGFFDKDFVNFNDELFRLPIFRIIEGLPQNKQNKIYHDEHQARAPGGMSGAGDNSGANPQPVEAEMRTGNNYGHSISGGKDEETAVMRKCGSDFA